MIPKVQPFRQRGKITVTPRNIRDRYDLTKMKVGESRFWAGVLNYEVSPYTTRAKYLGIGTFRVQKDEMDGRGGVTITRVK